MNDEYVDPIDRVPPGLRPEGLGAGQKRKPAERRGATVEGEVIAVRRKSGHHEGKHLLDATVGAREYDEVVVRVNSGEAHGLAGKRVTIRVIN